MPILSIGVGMFMMASTMEGLDLRPLAVIKWPMKVAWRTSKFILSALSFT